MAVFMAATALTVMAAMGRRTIIMAAMENNHYGRARTGEHGRDV